MVSGFGRLIRFHPKSDTSTILLGEPVDPDLDVGLALYKGQDVVVNVRSGISVLDAGEKTGRKEVVGKVLAPLDQGEVGSIRCIGLNYVSHAAEIGHKPQPTPTLFIKPATSLADPYPSPVILPKLTQADGTGDYESELAVVIGKTCKNVREEDAMDYLLGYTAANDVSSRKSQMESSQWCFSKGFDKACPIGPSIVSPNLIPDPSELHIRGLKNGRVMQDCGVDDMIFNIPHLVAFLSQGTTLPAGTVILTGTPPGVGFSKKPRQEFVKHGDEFAVEILPYIGTLIPRFENE